MRITTFSADYMPEAARDFLGRRFAELGGVLLLGGVGGLSVALATWSVQDPSWNHAAGGAVRNIAGPAGAIAADLIMQMSGVAIVAVLPPVVCWGWSLLTRRRLAQTKFRAVLLAVGGFAATAVASSLPTTDRWPLPSGFGGIIGDGLLGLPRRVLGNSATGILPSETKMSRDERCLLIENWMMHELLIRGHTDTEVNVWMSDKRNVKLWEKTGDVFGLSEYVRHRTNLDVNVLQTGINMAKNSPGMAARWIKTIPMTSLSYNSKPSRRSNGSPSRRTSIKSDVRTLPSSRSFSIKSWTINSIVLLLYVSIPFHIVSSYPFLFY